MSAWKKFSEGVPPKTRMGESIVFLVRQTPQSPAQPARWNDDLSAIEIGATPFGGGSTSEKTYGDMADENWDWTLMP